MPKKIISFQFIVFILLGTLLGLGVIAISGMPRRLLSMLILGIAFPFVAAIFGDVRRFLLICTVFSIPLIIDVNFVHIMEDQAGAHTLGVSLRDVFVILLLFFWILDLAGSEQKSFSFFAKISVPAIIYIEVCLLTLLWAPRLDLATLEIFQMVKVFILYFVVANQIRDHQDVKIVLWTLLASVAFECVIASLQMFFGNSLALGFLGETQIRERDLSKLLRAGGTLGHPNRLAMFLELLLPLVLGAFLIEKRFLHRLAALGIFVFGMAAVIMTGSRGGWAAVFISMLIFLFLLFRHKRIGFGTVSGAFFIVLISAGVVLSIFSETVERRLFGEDYGSAIGRIPMFQVAFSVIEAHPIGGVGVNNYGEVMQQYDDTILGRRFGELRRPVHNIYLLITGETGVIGLAVFLWLTLAVLQIISRTVNSTDRQLSIIGCGLFAGFCAYLLHGLVDKHLPGGNQQIYLLMALAVAVHKLSMREELSNSPAIDQ
ncbi:hypothetical protein A2V82_03280 [candidate division KSB1 bacterium RBG_16_48_16]|nr:MAG: hypothetical protein A2V82_03280 [candidate division KSB1 bacterium RBG_16_48_16]